ncbi:MAG: rod shape-determining protein MreC [Actinobacteria bacterium]|nr:MAG: rod shape-determining protein MreC [Actinomycetota bacterium]
MKQYHHRGNLRNRIILAAFLLAAVLLISVYYRNPKSSFIQNLKKATINGLAYIQVGANKVFSPVQNGWIFVIELANSKQENVHLKKELSGLKERLNDLSVIEAENRRLRGLVQVTVKKQYKTIMAISISSSSNNWEASIIIDKGSSKGVKERMPVISKEGLLGQVVNAGSFASQVQLITDTKSGVAAEIVGRNVKGLLQGTYDNKLEMTLVRKIRKVKKGDRVVTSGLGGVYPRGLYIGRVREAKSPATALYKYIRVESEVNFNNLQEMLVIKSPLPPNIESLK